MNSEEDEFFGPRFPCLGPDEDEEETQPEQSAGSRTNSHPPSNVVGLPANTGQPPANAGQPPANVPLTPRQILNRIYTPPEPGLFQEQLAERHLQSHPDPRGPSGGNRRRHTSIIQGDIQVYSRYFRSLQLDENQYLKSIHLV